eukprot:366028-Chlamydomonas_euryale.AAC.26
MAVAEVPSMQIERTCALTCSGVDSRSCHRALSPGHGLAPTRCVASYAGVFKPLNNTMSTTSVRCAMQPMCHLTRVHVPCTMLRHLPHTTSSPDHPNTCANVAATGMLTFPKPAPHLLPHNRPCRLISLGRHLRTKGD